MKDAKTILISAKCSDMFSAQLIDNMGNQIGEADGYVPKWFPSEKVQHFGDYVELAIDLETGRIMNWKRPSPSQLSSTFKKE